MPTPIQESFLALLTDAVEKAGNMNNLAKASKIGQSLISRWLARSRTPALDSVQQLLDYLEMEAKFVPVGQDPTAAVVPATKADREAMARKDELIATLREQLIALREQLAEARGEIKAMNRQLDRMTSPPTPIVLSTDKSQQ